MFIVTQELTKHAVNCFLVMFFCRHSPHFKAHQEKNDLVFPYSSTHNASDGSQDVFFGTLACVVMERWQ